MDRGSSRFGEVDDRPPGALVPQVQPSQEPILDVRLCGHRGTPSAHGGGLQPPPPLGLPPLLASHADVIMML